MDPVGDPGSERLGSVTERSSASQIALTQRTLSRALSAANLSTPSLYNNWKGQSNSNKLEPWPSATCVLAAIVPTSSLALECVGEGTERTSVQFNKSKQSLTTLPPVGRP